MQYIRYRCISAPRRYTPNSKEIKHLKVSNHTKDNWHACKFLKLVMNFQRKQFLFLVFLKIIDKSLTITIYEDLWGYKIQWYVKRGGAQSFTYFCPLKVDLCQDMNVEGFAFSM